MPLAQIGLFAATAIFLGVVGGTAGWLALTDDGSHAMPAMAESADDSKDSAHAAPDGKPDAATAGHETTGQGATGHDTTGHDTTGHADAAAEGDHASGNGAHVPDERTAEAAGAAHDSPDHKPPAVSHGKEGSGTADAPNAHASSDTHGTGDAAAGHFPATAPAAGQEPAAASDHGAGHSGAPAPEPATRPTVPASAPPPPQVAMAPTTVPSTATAPKPPPVVVSPDRRPLAPAPDPAITSEGRYGPLPIRSADGKLPWKVYSRPFEAPTGTPRIAIVVTNMGLAEQPTLAAIQDLPGEVTLAFSPYSSRLAEWVPAARAAGHEVLLQLPMEPRSTEFNDPGNKALLTANSPEVNLDRMEWVLSRAEGYVGLTNLMGSRFTVSPKDMQPVLVAMDQRGLLYVDSRESPASIAGRLAVEMGLPAATNDRFIDAEAARGPIDNRLAQLEQLALARGSAVGFAADYPVAIERLRFWIDGLEDRGFVLAPVSAVVRTAQPE